MKRSILAFMIGMLLIAPALQADQSSEKARLDDCYWDLMDAARASNEAMVHRSRNAPSLSRTTMDKKQRCYDIKVAYEKKHGKYSLPKPKH